MHTQTEPLSNFIDRRRYTRVATNNTVVYVLVDKAASKIGAGTGTVINISQSGLMLQTDHMVRSNYIYVVHKSIDKKMVSMVGKVIFSMEYEHGIFRTGISLKGDHEDNVHFRKEMLRVFHKKQLMGRETS